MKTVNKKKFDYILFCIILLLLGCGIVFVYSSSSFYAEKIFGDQYYFLKKELLFTSIGIIALFICTFLNYDLFKKSSHILLGIGAILLLLLNIKGLGVKIGGATRWLNIQIFKFEPSEVAKFCLIVYMAYSLAKKQAKIKTFSIGFLPHVLVSGFIILLILKQPDFGTAVSLIPIVLIMMFVAGVRPLYIVSSIIAVCPAAYFYVMNTPYRRSRILSFLNPWADSKKSGFQIIQSFLAMHEGGIFGVGLGQGRQKLFYLPQAHNDFILSIIGEEAGFIGIGFIILLFIGFLYRGIVISLKANNMFGTLLALGLTTLIVEYALINIGVASGVLPTKGLNLPYISYGGTSKIMSMIMAGVILSVSRRQL